MDAGDLVRFREGNGATWNIGILIKYEKWYKIAEILCRGEMISVHAAHVQLHRRHPDNVEMHRQKGKMEA
jgi:hypothetical protein